MEQYLQYQQLLSNNIAEQAESYNEKKASFEKSLARTEGEKNIIEKTTDAIGGLFMIKPTEALGKIAGRVVKKGIQKVTDVAKQKLTGQDEESTEQAETTETADVPEGTEMQTFSSSESNPLASAQESIMEADPEESFVDQLSPMRNEMMQNQQTRTTTAEDEIQTGESSGESIGDTASVGQEATTNTAGISGGEIGGEVGGEIGGEVGGEAGAEAGASLLLDIDPLTAIFGLILGIGSIVGGIEGADSIKSPTVPKVQPIQQSSVQFGF